MDVMHEGRMATATVLVCDLAGSTEQRSALGDDAADRLAVRGCERGHGNDDQEQREGE